MRIALIISILALFTGCSEQQQEMKKRKEAYTHLNKNIGWKITIPSEFQINDAQEIYENNRKGIEVTEDATGESFDTTYLQNAFGFQLDSANLFQSIVTQSEFPSQSDWLTSNANTKKLFYHLYEEQGVAVDTTATLIETIGGLEFQTYTLNLLGKKNEVLMHQVFYSTLINGQDFSVNIVGNTEKSLDKIKRIWLSSTFK